MYLLAYLFDVCFRGLRRLADDRQERVEAQGACCDIICYIYYYCQRYVLVPCIYIVLRQSAQGACYDILCYIHSYCLSAVLVLVHCMIHYYSCALLCVLHLLSIITTISCMMVLIQLLLLSISIMNIIVFTIVMSSMIIITIIIITIVIITYCGAEGADEGGALAPRPFVWVY